MTIWELRFRDGRGKGHHGTTFRYVLSEPARVSVRFSHVRGHIAMRDERAGKGRKRFNGKVGRHRLRPGRYLATLVATDAAGNRSKARRVTIRVLGPQLLWPAGDRRCSAPRCPAEVQAERKLEADDEASLRAV